MNIFMKHEWPSYLPKVNSVWQKINVARLNKELNTDQWVDGSTYGDLAIFILLIICAPCSGFNRYFKLTKS